MLFLLRHLDVYVALTTVLSDVQCLWWIGEKK